MIKKSLVIALTCFYTISIAPLYCTRELSAALQEDPEKLVVDKNSENKKYTRFFSEKEEKFAQFRRGILDGIFITSIHNLFPKLENDTSDYILKLLIGLLGLSAADAIDPVPMFPEKNSSEQLIQPTLMSRVVRISGVIVASVFTKMFILSVIYPDSHASR